MKPLRLPEPYRGLPNSVYVLFFANIVNSLGNFVWPFLTLFLTERMGLSKAAAGFFVTLSALAFAPGSLLGGKLADHLGRRRVFLVSRTLGALALLPCAFLGTSPAVPWLLIVMALLSGAADPAIYATVADLTTRQNRQGAYSLLYLGHNIGFAVGPMLAGLLYRRHLPWLFLGDGLTTLLSVLLIAALVPETLPRLSGRASEIEEEEVPEGERAEAGGLVRALRRRPEVVVFALVSMVFAFVYVQMHFGLPLQLGEVFGLAGPSRYGVLMTVNALTVVLCTTLVTRYSARFDPTQKVAAGGLLYAVGFGMIGFIRTMPLYVLSGFIWTLGEILITTSSSVYVASRAPVTHRGRFSAVVDIVTSAGFALGPVIMGPLIDRSGVGVVWPLSFLLGLAGTALMLLLWTMERARAGARAQGPETAGS
jgi:MFS family permease